MSQAILYKDFNPSSLAILGIEKNKLGGKVSFVETSISVCSVRITRHRSKSPTLSKNAPHLCSL